MTTPAKMILRMKRGDTLPSLVCKLTDGGVPVDLSPATAIQVLLRRGPGEAVLERTAVGSNDGTTTMTWEAGDTDEAGTLYGEVRVTWADGKRQTWPADGTFRVEIEADLD